MKIIINSNTYKLLVSMTLSALWWIILVVLHDLFENMPAVSRVFEILGGTEKGYIQALTYAAFCFGLIDILGKRSRLKEQYTGFDLGLLPREDQLVLTADEVSDIKLQALRLEKRGADFLVVDLVKKACAQYRNNQSVAETLQVLDLQTNTRKEEEESGLSMVNYMINAIMSIGFIGTLIGLSTAIGNAHLASAVGGMARLTSYLNVAFDTTLVALVLGLVLNFFFNRYVESLDTFFAKTKSYIIDNLISRIYEPEAQWSR